MPKHRITTMLGMTRGQSNFIWRHFHVQSENEKYWEKPSEDEDDNNEDDDEEEEFVEQTGAWTNHW
eukprot:4354970-Ditylum_brightwellii.AAC.1